MDHKNTHGEFHVFCFKSAIEKRLELVTYIVNYHRLGFMKYCNFVIGTFMWCYSMFSQKLREWMKSIHEIHFPIQFNYSVNYIQ